MLYRISLLPQDQKIICEYQNTEAICLDRAIYELQTDFQRKNLCKVHLEEMKILFEKEATEFFSDESVIPPTPHSEDLEL